MHTFPETLIRQETNLLPRPAIRFLCDYRPRLAGSLSRSVNFQRVYCVKAELALTWGFADFQQIMYLLLNKGILTRQIRHCTVMASALSGCFTYL
jgi:hypothetical protein